MKRKYHATQLFRKHPSSIRQVLYPPPQRWFSNWALPIRLLARNSWYLFCGVFLFCTQKHGQAAKPPHIRAPIGLGGTREAFAIICSWAHMLHAHIISIQLFLILLSEFYEHSKASIIRSINEWPHKSMDDVHCNLRTAHERPAAPQERPKSARERKPHWG